MLHNAFKRFPGQVQPVEAGIALLKPGQHPHGLLVMVEAAMIAHRRLKRVLAGMSERRVAKVVGKRHRLGKIVIQP